MHKVEVSVKTITKVEEINKISVETEGYEAMIEVINGVKVGVIKTGVEVVVQLVVDIEMTTLEKTLIMMNTTQKNSQIFRKQINREHQEAEGKGEEDMIEEREGVDIIIRKIEL